MALAIIVVAGLHVILSARYRVQPAWVVPAVPLTLLAVLIVGDAWRIDRQKTWLWSPTPSSPCSPLANLSADVRLVHDQIIPAARAAGFTALMTHSVLLLALLGIGFVIWAIVGVPLSVIPASRYMLAWGLDRTGPQTLGRVSDRMHTPVTAIVFCTVAAELALLALINIPQASLLGALLAQIAAFILVSVAGIAFPYRLKARWEAAGGRRVFGVPAVALAGAGGVISLGALMALFITDNSISSEFAVTAHLSVELMLGVIAAGVLFYIGALLYNRHRGIDLKLAYKTIPPE